MPTKKAAAGSQGLVVEYRPIAGLHLYTGNPRTHTKSQIQKITNSVKHFGWTNPVLTAADGSILCGAGRFEAAKLLGLDEVPTIAIEGMSEADKRAYIIADNALAEKAGWDKELLKIELDFLLMPELNFDIELTGLDMPEVEGIIFEHAASERDLEEAVEEVDPAEPVVSTVGDLWTIGNHCLLCGDAREAGSYECLLKGERAEFVITDPPYNLPIAGHVSGLGAITHREFAMASGEMTKAEFMAFFAAGS